MDVINFNVDNQFVTQTRYDYGMRSNTQYVLIDQNRNRVAFWYGPLDEATMIAEIDRLLISLGY